MKPGAALAIGLCPALLIAAVPPPRSPGRSSSPDEAMALEACLETVGALRGPPAPLASARAAALELGTALLDAERCAEDHCALYLPGLVAGRRRATLEAAERLRAATKGKP